MTTLEGAAVEFSGRGEMARRMSDLDWSTTCVGVPATWSPSLRTAVEICLGSRFPIVIFWGQEFATLYNDAYRPMLGDRKHPQFLGRPAEECWNEIWPTIGPMLAAVLDTGEATWSKDLVLPMVRNGFLEEAYFTFSYSPIPDGDGIGGVFCAVQETTEQVLGRRRLLTLRDLSVDADDAAEVASAAVAVLDRDPLDVPFALVCDATVAGEHRILAATSAARTAELPEGLADVVRRVAATGGSEVTDAIAGLDLLDHPDAWSVRPTAAHVLPIGPTAADRRGALVLGLSAGRPFDADYRRFSNLVADQIASAMARARAREEERRRVEALAEIDRAKTAFFSNVSHEFRTPLTLMLGPLADLHDRLGGALAPEDDELLTMAERNGRRLLRLVNTLLDFSRIEAGRVTATYEPVDLAADTAYIVAMFRSAFERAGVELVVDCPPLPADVFVDRELWEKIVANLVSNAFKFTFEGSVTVRLRPTDDGAGALLTVADTGVGVPAGEVARLFERFHRVEGAHGRTYEGSGIGLALVHELVRMHGGRIEASSTEGAGTTLEVVIPFGSAHLPRERVRPRETALSPSAGADVLEEILRWLPDGSDRVGASLGDAARSLPGPTDGAHIILADDNPDMREYLRRLLGERWLVTTAHDGAEALEAARRDPPDLVVSDVMMPRLDGIGLLEALRADPATNAIPVILLSARAGEEARIEGLEAGADDYVVKPFSARELVARVQARLEIAHARESARLATERERRALYDLFMQAPVPICTLRGDDLVFEIANEPYLRATGLTDVVGRRLADALPEARDQGFVDLLRGVLRTGEPYVGIEVPVVLNQPDGPHEEFFTFVYSPMRDMDGSIEGVMVVATLVTEQVRARRVVEDALAEQADLNRTLAEQREALERANAAKDEFLGLVSHELRTPITTIFGNAEVLRTRFDHLDRETQTAAIADISAEAERLHGIIENLLVLARGTQAEQMEPVLVDRIAERVVRLHREQHPGRQVELVVSAYRTTIDGSAIQVEQVIRNLLSNAEKYSPPEAAIEVVLAAAEDSLRIEVRDRGIGFEGGAPPMLFTPFYRSEAAAARAAGVGIGLVVCKRIVEALGGTIQAISRPGGGAVFTIELPLAHMDREEALLA